MNASVFPDPVDAAITRFSPLRRRGITALWTGVGVSKPVERTSKYGCFTIRYRKEWVERIRMLQDVDSISVVQLFST